MLAKHLSKWNIHYAWILLFACCVFELALQGVFNYCAGIFYVPVSSSLGISVGAFSVSASIYGISLGLFSPIAGKLFSRRYFSLQMACATVVMCVTYMLLSIANAVWQWYVAMIIIGICGSFLLILPIPILINNWFEKNAGIAVSITAAFSGLSGAVISPIGAKIILDFGWRKAYLTLGLAAVVFSVPIILLFVCASPEQVGLLPYGSAGEDISECKHNQVTSETRSTILSRKTLLVLATVALLSVFKNFHNHYSAFAASIGIDDMSGAKLMSLIMVGTIFFRLALGALNDRADIAKTLTFSLAVVFVSLLCVSLIYTNTIIFTAATFALGIGPAMMAVLPALITGNVFTRREYGSVFPIVTMVSTMASALSNSIIGFIYDAFGSYVPAMMLGVVVSILTYFLAKQALKTQA